VSAPPAIPLGVRLGPLELAHPIINASGTLDLFETADSLGPEGQRLLADPPLAAYVPKTVTLHPRRGNPPPRVVETEAGMLNSIGLPNMGVAAFIEKELPRLLALPRPLILNVGGFAPQEYAEAVARLREALDSTAPDWPSRVGLELNVSCPNIHSGCMLIGAVPEQTADTVARVRAVWPGLLVAKLTPNVSDPSPVARAAQEAGADAVSLVNTLKGLVLDRTTLLPYLGGVTGGLSGPAIRPIALRMVYDVAAAVEVPVIGMGGVAEAADVLDLLACGASVVAVGAAAFRDPWLYGRLVLGLEAELRRRGMTLSETIGCAQRDKVGGE
jgi:dihydroorotate dehydrogenase (NAD+) catalytic subunit